MFVVRLLAMKYMVFADIISTEQIYLILPNTSVNENKSEILKRSE